MPRDRHLVHCRFTSVATLWTIRDGESRTATSTFTQLLSSIDYSGRTLVPNGPAQILIALRLYRETLRPGGPVGQALTSGVSLVSIRQAPQSDAVPNKPCGFCGRKPPSKKKDGTLTDCRTDGKSRSVFHLPVYLSLAVTVSLDVYLSVHLSVCLTPSVSLSVCLSLSLSPCL